jgi:hypothetical protein
MIGMVKMAWKSTKKREGGREGYREREGNTLVCDTWQIIGQQN